MKKLSLTTLLFLVSFFVLGQTSPFSTRPSSTKHSNPGSFSLPFFEDWSSGSLETNNWTTDCDYWAIDGMVGNEKPSAKFSGSPLVQEQYDCSLVSDILDGNLFKVGQIMLDFEISLNNRINTDTEKLLVEVLDSTGWNTVAEFTNDGSFDWSAHSVDIADYALGHTFQIRFKATGPNSFNVKSWHIDNISLYRMCEAPENIEAYQIYGASEPAYIELNWSPPPSTIVDDYEWLHWDDGENENGVGLTNGGIFSVAAQWDNTQLEEYQGDTIKSIRFFLYDNGFSDIVVKIWTGEDAENLLYADTVNLPLANSWNIKDLDSVILINPTDNYRVGYTIVGQLPSYFPAGHDQGPAIPAYGDWIYTESGGWSPISDFGIDKNFNIQMKIMSSDTSAWNCSGFNIYRRLVNDEPDYSLYDFSQFNIDIPYYVYYDTVDHFDSPCYKVAAVWSNAGDTCISDFAFDIPQIDDYVCIILWEGIPINKDNQLLIYPNPASNQLNITTKDAAAIEEIRIYNLTGQLVFRGEMKNNSINISQLQSGMYMVEVVLGQRKIRKKLIVK